MAEGGYLLSNQSPEKEAGKPVVSIITVVFNAKAALEATIKNVLDQDYKNIEYIVVDGGSKDGTADLLKQYDQKIAKWISEPDKGIYDAMNKGIHLATGDYLWFMNAGDRIRSTSTISTIFSNPEAALADVIYGETELEDPNGKSLGTRSSYSTRKLPENLDWKSLRRGMVVSHQSFIPRRMLTPFYNTDYRCSGDIDWVIKILKKSRKTLNVHEVLSVFRMDGLSSKRKKLCWKERFIVFSEHYGFFTTIKDHIAIVARALFSKGKY